MEEFFRRENFPQLSLGDGEFIQSQDWVARAAAQKDHGFAVWGKLGINRLTQRVIARLDQFAKEPQVRRLRLRRACESPG
ncbi:MAG: hypothetical protein DMF06_04750 [Verrucomicrobia bacterium]|nr:MAG: hypothetical protein DMF06_04750 [Verrucomicrobiota bacterium]